MLALTVGNRVSNVPEAANLGPVLNAPLGVAFMIADQNGWVPTAPHCAIQVGNVYDENNVGYSALTAEAGPLCS